MFQSNMRTIILLLLRVHLAYSVTHTLQYYFTATTGISNFPRLVDVGMLNGEPISMYDSTSQKKVPKQKWMAENLDYEYWNGATEMRKARDQIFFSNIQVLMDRFNQTAGVHTVQLMYGCELDGGSTRGYFQYGYDGADFISLDKSTLTWTAANPQAVITKHKWEATGAEANYWKGYLENTCVEWVQKYVGYGKDTLERKVSPQVSLLQKSSSSPVSCLATGFYPKEVTISWMRNGQDHDEDVDLGELLPNEDGTFQKSSTLRVSSDELKNHEYSCVVEHQGETFRETLGGSLPIGIIVGVVVAVLLLVVIGVIVFKVMQKKKKPEFTQVNGSDDGSNKS